VGRHLGNPIRVGFLGAARRNKGFDRIPEIIESLVKLDLTYVVQLSDNAWENYEITLNKIKETKANIEFLDGTVSNEKLLQSIAMCDLLIMPYQAFCTKVQTRSSQP
jgi:glycosyltransferase involved in cell wall biosynthesis